MRRKLSAASESNGGDSVRYGALRSGFRTLTTVSREEYESSCTKDVVLCVDMDGIIQQIQRTCLHKQWTMKQLASMGRNTTDEARDVTFSL